ncbi:hypothetical protein Lser_V15G05339 [Lactuca serriola]
MDVEGKDDVRSLNATDWPSHRHENNLNQRFSQTTRSVSISIPRQEREAVEEKEIRNDNHQLGVNDEVKNKHLLRSGQLGMCNASYCTSCPISCYYERPLTFRVSQRFDHYNDDVQRRGVKAWKREKLSLLKHFMFGVINPHAKIVRGWTQLVITSCSFATFIDPLFCYLLSVNKGFKCIGIDSGMTTPIVVFRSMMDLIFLMHMLVQWGLQQISTLAGYQTPSYFFWEILFTMFIIGVGLLLFSFLIGSMQNFLQGLGRREMETLVRRRDVEEWMRHENLPENLRRKVRESEYFNGAATQGIDGETLVQNLPEDLQRDVRHHLFKFFKKVRIFAYMDEPLLDAIYERLRKKTYIKGGKVLYIGGVVTKMVFIARGKLESIVENGNKVPLSEGDVCGEELLISYFEHFCVNGGKRLISNRTVKCLSNVEAYVIWAAELEEVTNLFSEYFRNPRVQHAIRNKSLYWRSMAATTIQVAWRHYKKRQNHAKTSRGRTILQPL